VDLAVTQTNLVRGKKSRGKPPHHSDSGLEISASQKVRMKQLSFRRRNFQVAGAIGQNKKQTGEWKERFKHENFWAQNGYVGGRLLQESRRGARRLRTGALLGREWGMELSES